MSRKYLALLACLAATQAFATAPAQRKYAEVKYIMHELVRTHPTTTRSVIVGASDSGDTIEAVAIGDGAVHNLIVATHHGNEYGSTEVALAFAAAIADKPINGQTVYVVPVLNIGGYDRKYRWEGDANGNANDPNRDYPGPCNKQTSFHLKSTRALANFIERENIVVSATLHTFHPAVVYPWGFATYDLSTGYDDLYQTMANNATIYSHYQTGNSTKVIYAANGCYEDYAFWKQGIWSMLFELGNSHTPSQPAINEMIRTNVPGIRNMLELAPTTRAPSHDFTGRCQVGNMNIPLRHDE